MKRSHFVLVVCVAGCQHNPDAFVPYTGATPTVQPGDPYPGEHPYVPTSTSSYAACLHQKAKDLDDGTSDPVSVGMAIHGACIGQYQAYVDANIPSAISFNARMAFQAQVDRQQPFFCAAVVLAERKAKAQAVAQ